MHIQYTYILQYIRTYAHIHGCTYIHTYVSKYYKHVQYTHT